MYFTQQVLGIKGGYCAIATGFVGWMYIIGGTFFVIVFTAVFVFFLTEFWLGVCRSGRIVAKPFVQASMLLFVLPFIIDGQIYSLTLSNILKIGGFVIIAVFGEHMTRRLTTYHKRNGRCAV
jgi:uncharacterized membrane protein